MERHDYGHSGSFLLGCGISITSILKFNGNNKLRFHIFIDYFSDTDQKMFDVLAEKYKTRITIYLISCENLRTLHEL
ncbi:TPA: hypothetical protein N3A49_004164 [Salmonella enterica subsp. salamae serovar 56:l,v:z39]|nr:hypothetical protein [Salmonella enterica subsp. salamae serovar 56:l,v:z39]